MVEYVKFPECPRADVSLQEVTDFLFKSFWFSQGEGEDLHRSILLYGSVYYRNTLEQVDSIGRCYISSRLTERLGRYINHDDGMHADDAESQDGKFKEDLIGDQADWVVGSLFKSVGNNDVNESTDLRLAQQIIYRDSSFLIDRNGRPNRKNNSANEVHGAYFSHILHYGVLRMPTRSPAADAMFDYIGKALLVGERDFIRIKGIEDKYSRESFVVMSQNLARLVDCYRTYYPARVSQIEAVLGDKAKMPPESVVLI
ncbi:MAG: hypothetical protein WBP26_01320 [Candidatus Saccharimonadales bacterium]